jgi:murein L,D-transpeptidase YafK
VALQAKNYLVLSLGTIVFSISINSNAQSNVNNAINTNTVIASASLGTNDNKQPTQSYSGKIEQVVSVDAHLLEIYKLIASKKYEEAVKRIDILLQQYPNFSVALALKSDLLTILNQGNKDVNQTLILNQQGKMSIDSKVDNKINPKAPPSPPTYNNENLISQNKGASLREEAMARIKSLYERPDPRLIPRSLLNLAPRQKTALVVDPEKSRIYLYENVNGRPKFLFDYYITIGKKGVDKEQEGDNKTPLGVYNLGVPIPKKTLPDMYGYAAMPLSFPNEWDKRNNITGTNIWIHGVPSDTYSRPPRASEGCVVLTNPDLERLFKFTQVGTTPVVINKSTEWVDLDKWKKERDEALNLVKRWQEAWDTYDFESYKQLYSFNLFKSDKKNYEEWLKKYFIFFDQKQVRLQNMRHLSIYRYPTNEPTLLITFEQDMMIPDVMSKEKGKMKQSVLQKRQYWQYDGIKWEIVYENES